MEMQGDRVLMIMILVMILMIRMLVDPGDDAQAGLFSKSKEYFHDKDREKG